MDAEVFDVFDLSDYAFLQISRGGVAGNVITSQTAAEGVFKFRSGMVVSGNQESAQSPSTLHIRSTESFLENVEADKDPERLVGHGIRCQGHDYEIEGATGGDNNANGRREHYRLTLKATDFSDYEESS